MNTEDTKSNKYVLLFKVLFVSITVLSQLLLFFYSAVYFNKYAGYFTSFFTIIAIIISIRIICSIKSTSYKISWIFFLLIMPITGLFLYAIFGNARFGKKLGREIKETRIASQKFLEQNKDVFNKITDEDTKVACKGIKRNAGYPVYDNTEVEYLNLGEKYLEELLIELEKAEKFIFLEYFIVSDGEMHRKMMDILIDKAKKGVDVRYIYDAGGSQVTLPRNFVEECNGNNIKCYPFNPFTTNIYSFVSYRSHRKITIIDGNVGFTGGINIGDEYINKTSKYGHWKDMGIKLKGDAVFSLTTMFLDGWKLVCKDSNDDYNLYRPTINCSTTNCFVAPFDAPPLQSEEQPALDNYLRIIANSKNYIYITTPYLIIDSDMSSALTMAAKSGVDVRILTPHIPDKKMILEATRSHYGELLSAGVKVYEYTPGFVHGKVVVSDDKTSFVGSINFDYRSLNWNYECGAYVNNKEFALAVKDDLLKTFEISEEISYEKWVNPKVHERVIRGLLKVVCPLL